MTTVRSTLRSEGKSVKTANDYLAAVKGFTRWLWRDKRSVLDALSGLSKFANAGDIRHARRDLSPDELGLLLDTARQSPKAIRCLAGIDRYFLYLTAAATGFRASELASMTPASFNLNDDMPTATVQATCTKNHKLALQPLPRLPPHNQHQFAEVVVVLKLGEIMRMADPPAACDPHPQRGNWIT